MPRRWPTVTSSTASTVPTGSPRAVDHLGGMELHPVGRGTPPVPAALPMKHTSWLSGLAAVRRPSRGGVRPHLGLGHLPHREQHPGQLGLSQHGEHVGLVLGGVGAPAQPQRTRPSPVTRA